MLSCKSSSYVWAYSFHSLLRLTRTAGYSELLGKLGPPLPFDMLKLGLTRVGILAGVTCHGTQLSRCRRINSAILPWTPATQRKFVNLPVLDRARHHAQRAASQAWSINDLVSEAIRSCSDHATQVLEQNMPGLAVPQIVLTSTAAGPNQLCVHQAGEHDGITSASISAPEKPSLIMSGCENDSTHKQHRNTFPSRTARHASCMCTLLAAPASSLKPETLNLQLSAVRFVLGHFMGSLEFLQSLSPTGLQLALDLPLNRPQNLYPPVV